MDHFQLYSMPVSFLPDEQYIKQKYLELSKKYHPDYYALSSVEQQQEILELSTKINKAYAVLRDFDKRIKYILQQKNVLEEEEKYTLPQDFLMDMLDLNEKVMEAENDLAIKTEVQQELTITGDELLNSVRPLLENFSEETATAETYAAIKEFYYKRKYLLRIQEQLDTFAGS